MGALEWIANVRECVWSVRGCMNLPVDCTLVVDHIDGVRFSMLVFGVSQIGGVECNMTVIVSLLDCNRLNVCIPMYLKTMQG